MDRWDDSLVDPPLSEQNRRRNRGMRDAMERSEQDRDAVSGTADDQEWADVGTLGLAEAARRQLARQAPAERWEFCPATWSDSSGIRRCVLSPGHGEVNHQYVIQQLPQDAMDEFKELIRKAQTPFERFTVERIAMQRQKITALEAALAAEHQLREREYLASQEATKEQLRLTHIDWQNEYNRAEQAEARIKELEVALRKVRVTCKTCGADVTARYVSGSQTCGTCASALAYVSEVNSEALILALALVKEGGTE